MHIQKVFLLLVFFLIQIEGFAVKVRGAIFDPLGAGLGFSSVWVKGQSFGTTANADGQYVLELPGNSRYEIVYQYLGFKSHTEIVDLKNRDINLDVKLSPQATQLASVEVMSSKEDPAVRIMRKAIMKSKIHDKQVNSYTAKIYAKNTLLIRKVPSLLKKDLEKNNIKIGVPSITEELIELKYIQPNTRKIHYLAKQNSLDQVDISSGFYLLNLYKSSNSSGVVSPLAPNAFSYYNFEYIGFIEENGVLINKIQVKPKTFGPGVYRGQIWIVENTWNIHTFDGETVEQGILIRIKQHYAPIQNVWMPIAQTLDLDGKILGFDFGSKMQVNPNYEKLSVNRKFIEEVKLVESENRGKNSIQLGQQELTLKQLNKLIKAAEKESKQEKYTVVSNDSISYDSLYQKRDFNYWEKVRNVPLTEQEQRGYVLGDSIKVVALEKEEKVSNKWVQKITKPVSLSKSTQMNFKYPFVPFFSLNYDIIQGVFVDASVNIKHSAKPIKINWNNDFRYAFGPEKWMGKTQLELLRRKSTFDIGMERFSKNMDEKQNVPLFANSIFNLFGINLTQLYFNETINFGYEFRSSEAFKIQSQINIGRRSMMQNLAILKPKIGGRDLTPSVPVNRELDEVAFAQHHAIIWKTNISYLPGATYVIRNGKRSFSGSAWPTFQLEYKKGMGNVDFDFVSFGARQDIKLGAKESFKYFAEFGGFFNAQKLMIMDLKHVNSIDYSSQGNFAFYRILNTDLPVQLSPENYYRYSTQGPYVKFHGIRDFRKLFITQIPLARFTGLKEDLFINYLKTPVKNNYLELGYGIDGILKLLRFEVITAFEKNVKQRWGWQIGITI